MNKNKAFILIDSFLFLLQIFLMITLAKYTHNNSLYTYFCFSFVFNLLLFFSLSKKDKLYNIKIIILNLFLAITVYFFGNVMYIKNKDLVAFISNLIFNVVLFFLITGNWSLAFFVRRIYFLIMKTCE